MSAPSNVISDNVTPFNQGAVSGCAAHSPTPVFDERIQAMAPDALAASNALVSNTSFSSLAARCLAQSPASHNSSFALPSPNIFSSVASPNVTPAVDADEDFALVQDKLGGLLDELGVQQLTAFLKKDENAEILQKFKANQPFGLGIQDARPLGFIGALECVSSGGKYSIIEQLHENERGYFIVAGSKKVVTAAREWSFRDRVRTVSIAARQAMTLVGDRTRIQELTDIVRRHNTATQLANSGLPLVTSKIYRIGCHLLIVQPLAPALIMELTRGITGAQAIKMLLDISRGVAGLHAGNFAHRDLKPDNIGNVGRGGGQEDCYHINDFDTLLLTTAQREQGAPIGTPTYMSPEACRGGSRYDLKTSDVWSFGVTALVILFSVDLADSQVVLPLHPFLPAREAGGLMFQLGTLRSEDVIDAYFSRCIAQKPHLQRLYELVRGALHLDPARRITMAEFQERLTALVQQRSDADDVTEVA